MVVADLASKTNSVAPGNMLKSPDKRCGMSVELSVGQADDDCRNREEDMGQGRPGQVSGGEVTVPVKCAHSRHFSGRKRRVGARSFSRTLNMRRQSPQTKPGI